MCICAVVDVCVCLCVYEMIHSLDFIQVKRRGCMGVLLSRHQGSESPRGFSKGIFSWAFPFLNQGCHWPPRAAVYQLRFCGAAGRAPIFPRGHGTSWPWDVPDGVVGKCQMERQHESLSPHFPQNPHFWVSLHCQQKLRFLALHLTSGNLWHCCWCTLACGLWALTGTESTGSTTTKQGCLFTPLLCLQSL